MFLFIDIQILSIIYFQSYIYCIFTYCIFYCCKVVIVYSIFIYTIFNNSFYYILPPYPLRLINVYFLCLSCSSIYVTRFYLIFSGYTI
nr:MAG TPA: hypothetical protein [Caudoviricetes sp.]